MNMMAYTPQITPALHPAVEPFLELLTEAKQPGERVSLMRDAVLNGVGTWNIPECGKMRDDPPDIPVLVEISMFSLTGTGLTADEAVRSWMMAACRVIEADGETGLRAARQDLAFLHVQIPMIAAKRRVKLELVIADFVQSLLEGPHNCAPIETEALLDMIKARLSGDNDADALVALTEAIHRATNAYEMAAAS